VAVAASFSSPLNQGWFVRGQDRIWWRLKAKSPLLVLREAGAWVRAHSRPGDLLLTQDTYLAVEAQRRVPHGLELGPFSYFPDFPRARAERLHVLNREMLAELLATTPAPLAAFSGYGLAIRAPEIEELPASERDQLWDVVRSRYEELLQVEPFGQANTTLCLLRLRDAAPATP
jgi:hypothetical protein